MKIASYKTLNNNKKTRIKYTLSAIERDSFSEDEKVVEKSDKAFQMIAVMTKKEMMEWATRELEYKQLND